VNRITVGFVVNRLNDLPPNKRQSFWTPFQTFSRQQFAVAIHFDSGISF
jgi:hypothetical protein